MIRNKIESFREWLETSLRRLCGRISPDARVWVIVAMFLLFAALSLWFTVSSIYRFGRGDGERYRFGKGDGERMQIEQIERLELELRHKESQLDSVEHINYYQYEYDRETE